MERGHPYETADLGRSASRDDGLASMQRAWQFLAQHQWCQRCGRGPAAVCVQSVNGAAQALCRSCHAPEIRRRSAVRGQPDAVRRHQAPAQADLDRRRRQLHQVECQIQADARRNLADRVALATRREQLRWREADR
jgi:hypothetical protein